MDDVWDDAPDGDVVRGDFEREADARDAARAAGALANVRRVLLGP
jgi:hypothetical protein